MRRKYSEGSLIFLGLCIFCAYLLPYHLYPFEAFYNDWIVAVAIVVLLAFQLEQKILSIQLPWIAVIPFGLSVLIFVHASLGMLTVAWDAIIPISYLLLATYAVLFGASIGREEQGAFRLCNTLAIAHLAAGLASVGIASLQLVGAEAIFGALMLQLPHDIGVSIRPYANVAQPNQVALLFCMSIASVWWLFQNGKIRKAIGVASVLVLLWGLAITQSRIGWLILPFFSFLLWSWRRNTEFSQVPLWVSLAGLIIYVALVFNLPEIAGVLGSDVLNPLEHVGSPSASPRMVLLRQALHISLAHPLFGAGWYEFGPQQLTIAANFSNAVYAQHAHNIVMNFAAEIGWPLTLLIFGAIGYWLYAGYFRRRINKETGFALLFFTAVIVHSMVEFPLWYAYVLLPTALLIGIVHQQQFGSNSIKFSQRPIVLVCLLMALGLVGTALDYRRVVVGFRALGWESLGLHADEGGTGKPIFTIFPQFYDYMRFAKIYAHKGMKTDEIEWMEHETRRFGYAPVLMRMSLVYALNQRPADALRMMRTINKLHPDRYIDAYEAWKALAKRDPNSYSTIFKRLPLPENNSSTLTEK